MRDTAVPVVAVLAAFCAPVIQATEGGDSEWRAVDPHNTVYMTLAEGNVIIELNPAFAPQTVAQFKELVEDGFYDGLSFYRVIDGFVAQGGGPDLAEDEAKKLELPAEFERNSVDGIRFVIAQKTDLFAPETGFVHGFAAARDADAKKVWLTHCMGAVAMARGNEPGSGSTDFYIVIGQAPRYLDRNLTVFGRVIMGMDLVQRIQRGPSDKNGIIEEEDKRTRIETIRLAPENLALHVSNTNSAAFAEVLESRRNRTHEFFYHKPPQVLDVCQVPVGVTESAPQTP